MTATQLKQRIAHYRRLRKLWVAACRYDGIDPTSPFVVWSEDNLKAKQYNQAMKRYQKGH